MYNYYFFDLDGTLVEKGSNKISAKNLNTIKELKRKGHVIILNTGRDLKRTLAITELCKYVDFIICSLGSLLTDNKGKVIKKETIPQDICNKVFNDLYSKLIIGYGTVDGEKIINNNDLKLYYENCKFENREIGNIVSKEEYFEDVKNNNILNFYFYTKEKIIGFSELSLIKSYNNCYDVNLKKVDKGYFIRTYFNTRKTSKYYAFGDGGNDVAMFVACDCSITFIDSSKEAKSKATIVSSVESKNDGVAYVLNNLLKTD